MNYYKILILLIIISATAISKLQAQDVLLREDREKKSADSLFGPNQRHYIHLVLGTGFAAGRPEGNIAIRYSSSLEFISEIKYKRKLSGLFSIGAGIGYRYTKFGIAQRDEIDFADTVFATGRNSHESEKFGFHAMPLSGFLRINFDPHRGNTIGNYLELGGSGEWVLGSEYVADDILADKIKRKMKFTGFPFVNPFQYHASAKIGLRWLALGVRYRFSDYFKASYNFPEMPRFSVTAEINFVR